MAGQVTPPTGVDPAIRLVLFQVVFRGGGSEEGGGEGERGGCQLSCDSCQAAVAGSTGRCHKGEQYIIVMSYTVCDVAGSRGGSQERMLPFHVTVCTDCVPGPFHVADHNSSSEN